jgi:hypothetical protein
MGKIFLFLFIIILLTCSLGALAQTDGAGRYQSAWLSSLLKNLQLFFAKIFVYSIEAGKKVITFLRDKIFQDIVSWIKNRRGAIQQGIGEEKQELKEGLLQYLKNFWQSERYYFVSDKIFQEAPLLLKVFLSREVPLFLRGV